MSKERKTRGADSVKRLVGRFVSLSGKAGNDSRWSARRNMNNANLDLGVMNDYPGSMAVLVNTLKEEGVRFNKADFLDDEITIHNHYVVSFRGRAYEVVHRALERRERRIARRKATIELMSGQACLIVLTRCYKVIKSGMRHLLVGIHDKCVNASNKE